MIDERQFVHNSEANNKNLTKKIFLVGSRSTIRNMSDDAQFWSLSQRALAKSENTIVSITKVHFTGG